MDNKKIRPPAVAGMFYPQEKQSLIKNLDKIIPKTSQKQKAIGLISPHAGYVYSGSCAGKGFSAIQIPKTIILLGVNHRGCNLPFVIDNHDFWETPLGTIPVHKHLAQALADHGDSFSLDSHSSLAEHSLEVQVPFIQYLNPNASILPISVSAFDSTEIQQAALELANLLKDQSDYLLLASTDMSHYISADAAKIQDEKAIKHILDLNPHALLETVQREQISMCGVAPAALMLFSARQLGASQAQLIDYTNSGKVNNDYRQVVAYLSAIVI